MNGGSGRLIPRRRHVNSIWTPKRHSKLFGLHLDSTVLIGPKGRGLCSDPPLQVTDRSAGKRLWSELQGRGLNRRNRTRSRCPWLYGELFDQDEKALRK